MLQLARMSSLPAEGCSLMSPTARPRAPSSASSTCLPPHSFSSTGTNIRRQATMASATVSATMAATGFDKRNSTSTTSSSSSLQTPGSGTFPSELRSPMAYSPGFLRKDDALKTPITPPSAYLDFLKNMSPAIMSPMSTSTSSRFNFNEKPAHQPTSEPSSDKASISPPISQPTLSRNTSYDSDASAMTSTTSASEQSMASSTTRTGQRTRPESPRITIPPSPFAKPGPRSARTPRRLQIPQSPYSPAMNTATSMHSPYSSTPLSAAPWSASFPSRDADVDANSKPGRVSVRHVVTRTVTYCRTPLEPAPRGKRRKLDNQLANDDLPKVTEVSNDSNDDKAVSHKSEKSPKIKQESSEIDHATVTQVQA